MRNAATNHRPHRPLESPRSCRHRDFACPARPGTPQEPRRSGDSLRVVGACESLRRPRSIRPRSDAPLAHRLRLRERGRHPPPAPRPSKRHRFLSRRIRPEALRRDTSPHLASPPPESVTSTERGMGAWLQLCSPRTKLCAWHPLPSRLHLQGPCGGAPGTALCSDDDPAVRRDPHNADAGLPREARSYHPSKLSWRPPAHEQRGRSPSNPPSSDHAARATLGLRDAKASRRPRRPGFKETGVRGRVRDAGTGSNRTRTSPLFLTRPLALSQTLSRPLPPPDE